MYGYRLPIDYTTVSGAVGGDPDPEAVQLVLEYYTNYINKLATRRCFDMEAKCRLESKLLRALQQFNA